MPDLEKLKEVAILGLALQYQEEEEEVIYEVDDYEEEEGDVIFSMTFTFED